MYYVYIIECLDKSLYTGVTNNIERRLWEHNEGIGDDSYTKSRLPVKLIYHEEHKFVNDAISREKQIKGWSKSKKLALSNGFIYKLKQLSKSHTSASSV